MLCHPYPVLCHPYHVPGLIDASLDAVFAREDFMDVFDKGEDFDSIAFQVTMYWLVCTTYVLFATCSLLCVFYFTFHTPHSSSLLTPHSSLLTPHSSLRTPHSSLLTPHSSLRTPHSSLLTPNSSLLTPHSSLLITHY